MEIKYKLYPYPVLSSYSNDYGTGAFDVAIDIVRDGYDLRIDFLATLTCQSPSNHQLPQQTDRFAICHLLPCSAECILR